MPVLEVRANREAANLLIPEDKLPGACDLGDSHRSLGTAVLVRKCREDFATALREEQLRTAREQAPAAAGLSGRALAGC